ncbi:MAG: DNA-directed RNA polymerase subunit beta', partial [Alphaproteobacteria bacterium]|nr:DNA-directed RNA polymerase subunit beta' [Alphaproteobacteria bacterium]
EGKAIQLHPLVCAAFNADFDGDQMAVHVPLSLEAQLEARVLMMSTNNILRPSDGKPIIVPSQDIVLGLYFMTIERPGAAGEGMVFSNLGEIEHALASGAVTLHTTIKARRISADAEGNEFAERVDTTPGRMMLGDLLPRHPQVPFSLVNRLLTKRDISTVIDVVYRHTGQKETVLFCDRIMALGFRHAFKAGISFGKDDMVVPKAKTKMVDDTRELAKEYEQQYTDGLITQGEKYNKVIDAWSKCTDRVADEMMAEISNAGVDEQGKAKPLNSIYMMAHSGARGSAAQMKQLAGMRGLMAKPSGEIIETPIISNFKEGLTVLEYFNSTHGARKGLADTALKTANSGYLTRRLVDVAQDCIIKEQDCGTLRGLNVAAVVEGGEVLQRLGDRILGRTVCDDVLHPVGDAVLASAGQEINEATVELIEAADIQSVRIRSVLTCDSKVGVCAKCYGRDLARGTPVNIGEAVGVIAAQSIGEPGTQLTMRTFHIGGTAQVAEQSFIEATHEGVLQIENKNLVTDRTGRQVVLSRNCILAIVDDNGRQRATHKVPYGTRLLQKEGGRVTKGLRLCEWDPYTLPIITEKSGIVKFVDLVDGISVRDMVDDTTGITNKIVVDWRSSPKGGDLKPGIAIVDDKGEPVKLGTGDLDVRYLLSVDAILSVDDGDEVAAGDVLARIPRESAKTRDITGGLPRVAELFEARRPKDHAVLAEMDGIVKFGRDYKNKRRIIVEATDDPTVTSEYLIPKGKHVAVQEGDFIRKGEFLLDGNPAPHDILAILGVEELANYLVQEIQEVYRLQGVPINDKHIEVIVRQMLQKAEVTNPGETTLLKGEQIDRLELDEINEKVVAEGRQPAEAVPVLLGITKAS